MAPPHAVAILRIAFALYLLIEAATYVPHITEMFSSDGFTFSAWSHFLPTSLQPVLDPPSPLVAHGIALVYLLACMGLLCGFGMRFSLILLLFLNLYYWQVSFFEFPSSYHRIYFVLQFLLLFSGADKTFSLRMLRTHGSIFAWENVCVFAQRVLMVQLTITYLGVGLQKTWLPDWQDGAALSHSIINRWATPLGRWVVEQNLPFGFYSVAVLGIKIGEFFLPCMLWLRDWRILAVFLGASFHIGIAALMSIWWFIPLIACYILFWPSEEVYLWFKRQFPASIQ